MSNEFIIEAPAKKYQHHLPVYRPCAVLAGNHGIELELRQPDRRPAVDGPALQRGGAGARISRGELRDLPGIFPSGADSGQMRIFLRGGRNNLRGQM